MFMKSLIRFPHWLRDVYYFQKRTVKWGWPPCTVCEIISKNSVTFLKSPRSLSMFPCWKLLSYQKIEFCATLILTLYISKRNIFQNVCKLFLFNISSVAFLTSKLGNPEYSMVIDCLMAMKSSSAKTVTFTIDYTCNMAMFFPMTCLCCIPPGCIASGNASQWEREN